MMFIKSLFALAIGQAILVNAAPNAPKGNDVEILPGYKTVVPIFSGELYGEKYELKGTAESVYQQLQKKYPGRDVSKEWGADMNLNTTDLADERRTKGSLSCLPINGQNWEKTWSDAAYQAAKILQGYGRITIGARSCALLTCAGGFAQARRASVFLCNDRNYSIDPAMVYIASYVTDILIRCPGVIVRIGPPRYLSGGQFFDSDGYNVILRETRTCQ